MRCRAAAILPVVISSLLLVCQPLSSQYASHDAPPYAGMRNTGLAVAEVIASNVGIWAFGHYVLDGGWTQISWKTVEANLRHGYEWDPNHFRTNFFEHPFHGSLYYNSARTNGLSFWESIPYTAGGSAMWELFMESEYPSWNDWVMTTMGGIALGEAFFRFSNQILDDRARGADRVWREGLAALINPVGGLNRIISGSMFRSSSSINHIRNPLSGFVSVGGSGNFTGIGDTEVESAASWQGFLAYGDPFLDKPKRTPFDFFTFRMWSSAGKNERNLAILQRALLVGKNYETKGGKKHLLGLFQYYDYIDNEIIDIGSMSLGAGLFSEFELGGGFRLVTSPHLGPVILGASNTEYFTDDERDYNYGWGFQGKLEGLLEHTRFGSLLLYYNYFGLYTADGAYGVERLNVFDAMYKLPLFRNWGIGFEVFLYDRNATYNDFPDVNKDITGFRGLVTLDF